MRYISYIYKKPEIVIEITSEENVLQETVSKVLNKFNEELNELKSRMKKSETPSIFDIGGVPCVVGLGSDLPDTESMATVHSNESIVNRRRIGKIPKTISKNDIEQQRLKGKIPDIPGIIGRKNFKNRGK